MSSFASSSSSMYAVAIASTLRLYDTKSSYERGDFPAQYLCIVGAAPSGNNGTTFRMMTHQGTQWDATAPSASCAMTWLQALRVGLRLRLLHEQTTDPTAWCPDMRPPDPPAAATPRRKVSLLFGQKSIPYCKSCGKTTSHTSTSGSGSGGGSTGTTSSTAASSSSSSTAFQLVSIPLPQYGWESRVDCCVDCMRSQGLWHTLHDTVLHLHAAAMEHEACVEVLAAVQQQHLLVYH